MALIVKLKSVEYIEGKADRLVRLTFRGHSYDSDVVRDAKRIAFFDQAFEWPLARGLKPEETITLQLFNNNKYLANKLIGSYSLFVQQLMQDGKLDICDPLVDSNNRMLETLISFQVQYYSPDGKVGDWSNKTDFVSPVVNFSDQLDVVDSGQRGVYDDIDDLNAVLDTELLGGLANDETASQNILMDQMFENKQVRPLMSDEEMYRVKDFEVRVTIIKAEQLAGLDIDPVIRVDVGEANRYTTISQSTNCPYFNDYMVFNFRATPAIIFDKILTITAYHAWGIPGRNILRAGNMVAGKRLIGVFKCDLGTVFANEGHQFWHKWAVLIDPKDTTAGPKGYVKCDIAVCSRGSTIKQPQGILDEETDSIEGHLLLPVGVPLHRQHAAYNITIYRAEDLPRTDLGVLASMQKALTKKDVAFINACVKVSFVGHVGRTSVRKSYHPEWKEELWFVDAFPPLCNRIKIELCDSAIPVDDVVATHFIELAQIMDPGGEGDGILPSFGPSWINLYGSPRGYKMVGGDNDENTNQGLGEGCAFRGRLLISIDTAIVEGVLAGKSRVERKKLMRSSAVMDNFKRRPFLLFATLFEASMIDKQLENKPIYFEISIGKFGNNLDGRASTTILGDDDHASDSDDSENDDASKRLMKKQRREEDAVCASHSETQPRSMQSIDKNYGYLPITAEKPCMFTVGLFEDFRKRLFHTNLLLRLTESLEEGLLDVKEMCKTEDPLAHRRLKGTMEKLLQDCDHYLQMWNGLLSGAGAGKNNLDKYRLKMCRKYVEKVRVKASEIRKSTMAHNVLDKYFQIKEHTKKLRQILKDPQHALPDVILWMVCDSKRIAYHRFRARDIIYAHESVECGKDCGKRQNIFLRKPGKKNQGEQGWMVQAKLDISIWLGEHEPSKSEKAYLKELPQGYEKHYSDDQPDESLPPVAIIYENEYKFQLRAYIYQARSLIGSDASGLSDPFARVIVSNYCQSSQIVNETLCPMWDETLVFDNIVIYGIRDDLIQRPPVVIIEVYDYDLVGDPEFLGRCKAIPKVKLEDESYDPVTLEWFDVYRGVFKAGEVLAGFELLEGDIMSLPDLPESKGYGRNRQPLYKVPEQIRPDLVKYRLEILFRGVRELKKMQMQEIKQPRIVIECVGKQSKGESKTKESTTIKNTELNSNFEQPLQYIDIMLPRNTVFWPPITIRCIEHRTFGRELLVGLATVDHMIDYIWLSEEEQEQMAAEELQSLGAPSNLAIQQGGEQQGGEITVVTIENPPGGGITSDSVAIDIPDVARVDSRLPVSGRSFSRQASVAGSHKSDAGKTQGQGANLDQVIVGEGGGQDAVTVVGKPKSAFARSVGGKSRKPLDPLAEELAEQQKAEREKKQRLHYRDLISELDWWSKYYVMKEDLAKAKEEAEKKDKMELLDDSKSVTDKEEVTVNQTDSTGKSGISAAIATIKEKFVTFADHREIDYGVDMIDYSELNTARLLQMQKEAKKRAAELEAEENKKKKKRKKKRKKKKKKLTQRIRDMKGVINSAFQKDENEADDDIFGIFNNDKPEDKSHIARIQYFDCELSEVEDFEGFEEYFETFPLYRGKKSVENDEDDEDDNDRRLAGYFKGMFCIYKVDESTDDLDGDGETANNVVGQQPAIQQAITGTLRATGKAITEVLTDGENNDDLEKQRRLKLFPGLPINRPVEVKVNVYIVKAIDLHPVDLNGLADPYLILRCGRKKVIDKENKIFNQLNPVFGRLFEFEVEFPMDSMLYIDVYDYDTISADDVIGSTKIDLENRFFSRHRARCSLQQKYEIFGYNTWRDPMKPTQILEKLCRDCNLIQPIYSPGKVAVAGIDYFASEVVENEGGEVLQTREHLALEALHHWEDVPGGYRLVPEHIETRPLFCDERPGVQGLLEMWVEIYPKDQPLPTVQLDITPRKPDSYELRCIIWNTDDVALDDVNPLTGEASSDIYVKGFVKGPGEDVLETDVHYRSLTGEGNFNWRFIFPFDYFKAEEKIVYKKKASILDMNEVEHKVPPVLNLQIWDADLISSDDILGSITMDLNRIPKPAKNHKFCTLKMVDPKEKVPTLNLFKTKRCKGWWPVFASEKNEETGEEERVLKGKVEAELHLLTAEEAEKAPVGLARKEPEALSMPNRPDSSFLWFLNPMKTLRYVFWKNYKWLLLKIFLILLFIVFFAMFIYAMPGYTVMKIWSI